jgi:hypothetical protein
MSPWTAVFNLNNGMIRVSAVPDRSSNGSFTTDHGHSLIGLLQYQMSLYKQVYCFVVTVQGFQEREILPLIEGHLGGFMGTLPVAFEDPGEVYIRFVRDVFKGNLQSHTPLEFPQRGGRINFHGGYEVILAGPVCGDDASAYYGKFGRRGMIDPACPHFL